MEPLPLKEYERIDDLITQDLKIIQSEEAFRFGTDAVLLANFASVRKGDKVIDLGTGGGVIPLLVAAKTKAREVWGLEIQEYLADMASRSVALNKLEDKIKIIQGDLKEIPKSFTAGSFQMVISNPPYYPLDPGRHINPNTTVAIAKHELQATLEDVIKGAAFLVNTNGRAAFVHRPYRLVDILTTMRQHYLEPKRLRLVHPKLGSNPSLGLVEGIKRGKPGLDILPPLYIYDEKGNYTQELQEIYYGKGEE